MKATELLKRQHDEVKAILKLLEKANGQTNALLEKLANNIAAHMVIEQELFYPAVLKVKESLVLEGYEEHAVARFALKRLMKSSPDDHTFKAKVTTLREILEHHMEEEEDELFPRADKELGENSEGLAEEMKALFQQTVKAGYARTIGRGGPAVTSAVAPDVHVG